MRRAAGVAVATVVLAGGLGLALVRDDEPPPDPLPTALPSLPVEPLDHRDDYTAPAEELVEHADHLDLSRLDPAKRAALEALLERRQQQADSLWRAYGSLVGEGPTPSELSLNELSYLLLAARAEDLAARGGAGGKEHPQVARALRAGCVTVAWSGDPFGRSFGARVAPRGSGDLRSRLEAAVRVGTGSGSACDGQPLALSPDLEAYLAG